MYTAAVEVKDGMERLLQSPVPVHSSVMLRKTDVCGRAVVRGGGTVNIQMPSPILVKSVPDDQDWLKGDQNTLTATATTLMDQTTKAQAAADALGQKQTAADADRQVANLKMLSVMVRIKNAPDMATRLRGDDETAGTDPTTWPALQTKFATLAKQLQVQSDLYAQQRATLLATKAATQNKINKIYDTIPQIRAAFLAGLRASTPTVQTRITEPMISQDNFVYLQI